MQADRIYCGDALTVLKTLPDNSVNCCVRCWTFSAYRMPRTEVKPHEQALTPAAV